jgi:hypothetical protein
MLVLTLCLCNMDMGSVGNVSEVRYVSVFRDEEGGVNEVKCNPCASP